MPRNRLRSVCDDVGVTKSVELRSHDNRLLGGLHVLNRTTISIALVTHSAADQGGDHVEADNEVLGIEESRSCRCPERELADRVLMTFENDQL